MQQQSKEKPQMSKTWPAGCVRASDVLSEHSLTLTDLAANATPRSDVTVFRPRLEHLSRPGRVVLSPVTHPGWFVPSSLLFPESVAGGGGWGLIRLGKKNADADEGLGPSVDRPEPLTHFSVFPQHAGEAQECAGFYLIHPNSSWFL